jgi:hypothetical protein
LVITEKDNTVVRKKLVLSNSDIKIFIFNYEINQEVILPNNSIITLSTFTDIVAKFNNLVVCTGGLPLKDAPSNFTNSLYVEDHFAKVWRHKACSYFLSAVNDASKNTTCVFCVKIKKAVRDFKYCKKKNGKKIPRVRMAFQRAANLRKRAKSLKVKHQKILQELKSARQKIRALDEDDILNKINKLNMSAAQKMLLSECINVCKYKRKTSRRYTSEWLLLCLLLYIRSPASYKFLQTNDILPLPAISTVKGYLSRINLKCGVDDKFFELFKLKMQEKNKYQRHGIIIFDEMQVRESIELNVKNMKLYGVQDFGEDNVQTSKTSDQRANHALVFMFSSVADQFCQPVAIYAAKGPTKGICIAQLIIAIIRKLEKHGAIIDAVVCDGATTNRKMWNEFGISGKIDTPVNKITHPSDDNRFLYFFSDAPHLIKCLRNRLLDKSVLRVSINKKNYF